jgi:hypothetical protein
MRESSNVFGEEEVDGEKDFFEGEVGNPNA